MKHHHHHQFHSLLRKASFGILIGSVLGFGPLAVGQRTSDIISDEIASHFNQVFSDETSVYSPEKTSWVPGNDKDTRLLGSVWTFGASATHVFAAGVDGLKGRDAEVQYGDFSINGSFPVKPRHKLSFAFRDTFYRVNETTQLGPDVFEVEQANKVDLGFMYRYGLNPRWELLTGGGISYSDSDVDGIGGKHTLLAYGGAAYTFNPSLTIAFAASVASRQFHGNQPFPLFIVDWRINDRSRLIVRDALYYRYSLNKTWTDVIGVLFDGTSITLHMDDRNIDGIRRTDPVLVVQDYRFAVTYDHTFSNGLIFTTRVGLLHVGQHGYWDNDEEISKIEVKPSMGLSLGLNYRF